MKYLGSSLFCFKWYVLGVKSSSSHAQISLLYNFLTSIPDLFIWDPSPRAIRCHGLCWRLFELRKKGKREWKSSPRSSRFLSFSRRRDRTSGQRCAPRVSKILERRGCVRRGRVSSEKERKHLLCRLGEIGL